MMKSRPAGIVNDPTSTEHITRMTHVPHRCCIVSKALTVSHNGAASWGH